jgi:hypothetical protein
MRKNNYRIRPHSRHFIEFEQLERRCVLSGLSLLSTSPAQNLSSIIPHATATNLVAPTTTAARNVVPATDELLSQPSAHVSVPLAQTVNTLVQPSASALTAAVQPLAQAIVPPTDTSSTAATAANSSVVPLLGSVNRVLAPEYLPAIAPVAQAAALTQPVAAAALASSEPTIQQPLQAPPNSNVISPVEQLTPGVIEQSAAIVVDAPTPSDIPNSALSESGESIVNTSQPIALAPIVDQTDAPFAQQNASSLISIQSVNTSPAQVDLRKTESGEDNSDSDESVQPLFGPEAKVKYKVVPDIDDISPARKSAGLLTNFMPFDPAPLSLAMRQFLDKANDAGSELTDSLEGADLAPWLVTAAMAAAAYEVARRQIPLSQFGTTPPPGGSPGIG